MEDWSMNNLSSLGMQCVDTFSDHEDYYSLPDIACDGSKNISNAQKDILLLYWKLGNMEHVPQLTKVHKT
jgi:hypothetical protein